MLQNQMLKLVEQRLRRRNLPVRLEFWNGMALALSDVPEVEVRVRSPKALRSLIKPTLGRLAKDYVEQRIDLEGDARTIVGFGESLCDASASVGQKGGLGLNWWRHSRTSDRRNIQRHYDVSNDFYGLWLDRRRVYSCAYFRRPDDSLDTAQEQKLDHICRKLGLKEGDSFLDIGCGWGGLILWAAENYGVRATGITLSQHQYDYVQAQIRERGLADRCQVKLLDYRDVPETEPFDKIASVGMFEHVGRKNLPVYFGKIQRLLKPGGLVLNHGITAAGLDSVGLGSGVSEFIEEYVFPGGELTHVAKVVEEMAGQNLECLDVESLRPHYAKTLWHWVERLEARREEARRLVGENKYRVWRIYMAGSAHAFDHGWLSIFQILAAKPTDDGRVPYPFTRDHVYVRT